MNAASTNLFAIVEPHLFCIGPFKQYHPSTAVTSSQMVATFIELNGRDDIHCQEKKNQK